jgi:hypothetical protein
MYASGLFRPQDVESSDANERRRLPEAKTQAGARRVQGAGLSDRRRHVTAAAITMWTMLAGSGTALNSTT